MVRLRFRVRFLFITAALVFVLSGVSSVLAGAKAIEKFNFVWIMVCAIVIFSFGEMLSSPKSSEYLGNIAPSQKKAMFLGFAQIPVGVGWVAEGYLGPMLYGEYSSKENISRQMLTEAGLDVTIIPNGEAFAKLIEVTGQTSVEE